MKKFWTDEGFWRMLALALFALMLLALICNCKSWRHTATHDTIFVDKWRTEYSVRVDSVWNDRWHTIYTSGDTVYRFDSVALYRYIYKHDTINSRDSIYISKADTTAIEVAKPLSGWRKFEIGGFWVLLFAAVGVGVWKLYQLYRRVKP